jgi:hypothetical protein
VGDLGVGETTRGGRCRRRERSGAPPRREDQVSDSRRRLEVLEHLEVMDLLDVCSFVLFSFAL